MEPKLIKDLILNAREPFILRKFSSSWSCFKFTFKEWCCKFDEEIDGKKLEFEKDGKFHTNLPQWEMYRSKELLTLKEFLNYCISERGESGDEWYTFSYKNISEIPEACRKKVDFSDFGFPDVKDITFWLSSTCAHTPCHYDTYGCNIVVQVFGSKMWLLFPPDAPLTALRVPYEESSVYCSETFYSPKDVSQCYHVAEHCYKCVLEPGDVLIVPNKWWHYVESLTPSLCINTWIPLEVDDEARVEECIVRYIVSKFIKFGTENEIKNIVNPNEILTLGNEEINLGILNHLLKREAVGGESYRYQHMKTTDLLALVNSLKIEWVDKLDKNDFISLIRGQAYRYASDLCNLELDINTQIKQTLINSICNPQVIASIKSLFTQYLSANK